jgi:hypothetical protein
LGNVFEFEAAIRKCPEQNVCFVFRTPNSKEELVNDFCRALEVKRYKFERYLSFSGVERILIIESQDMQLQSFESLVEGYNKAATLTDLNCYTQIWLMHSGKEHIGFYRRLFCLVGLSELIERNYQYQSMR